MNLDSTKADFVHNRGLSYRKDGQLLEVINDFEATLELEKDHYKAYYNRGYCFELLAEYDKAETDYLASLRGNLRI